MRIFRRWSRNLMVTWTQSRGMLNRSKALPRLWQRAKQRFKPPCLIILTAHSMTKWFWARSKDRMVGNPQGRAGLPREVRLGLGLNDNMTSNSVVYGLDEGVATFLNKDTQDVVV